ncbi:MAG: NrsF family protein [Hyphomicrobiaceae bacterium]
MKTDDLISALTADVATKPTPVSRSVALAVVVGLPIAAAIPIYAIDVRPDLWGQLGADPRFTFKFVFTLATAAVGVWLALRLSRPGTSAGPALAALGATAALLIAADTTELMVLPRSEWASALIGARALDCVVLIPLLAAAPLAALLFAMRSGAPDNPSIAGAAAGLLAGAIGATLYASHCTNDSPLFISVWYVIGIAAVTLTGGLIGRKVLRW